MDICVFNPFFYPYSGGTETVILEVYRRLAKRHNVTVITSEFGGRGLPNRDEVYGIDVVRLRSRSMIIPGAPLPYIFMDGIDRMADVHKSDIYHINNRFQYSMSLVDRIRRNGKFAITIHNSLPSGIDAVTDGAGLVYDYIKGRRMVSAADLITCVSRSALETTVPRYAQGRSYVVYNGVDYKRFRKRSKGSKSIRDIIKRFGLDSITILDTGRLVSQKGHIYLIRAVERLLRYYDVKLLILGDGPDRAMLERRCTDLGVEGSVIFGGKVQHEMAPYYYNAADLFSLPSTYEPASIAVLEAMASEVPVVASRVGGVPEMLGRSGMYVRPRDEDALFRSLRRVITMNERERGRMVRSGRDKVMREHDWDRIAKRYEELFYNTIRY